MALKDECPCTERQNSGEIPDMRGNTRNDGVHDLLQVPKNTCALGRINVLDRIRCGLKESSIHYRKKLSCFIYMILVIGLVFFDINLIIVSKHLLVNLLNYLLFNSYQFQMYMITISFGLPVLLICYRLLLLGGGSGF